MKQQTGSKLGKEYIKAGILSPCLFNFYANITAIYLFSSNVESYAEYIMQNARLDEAQAGIKIVRRNINNLRYVDDTTLMAES